jgi:ribose 5-phosphate isomerase RpiB
MMYIASDHGGYTLKEAVIAYLTTHAIEVYDQGTYDNVSVINNNLLK